MTYSIINFIGLCFLTLVQVNIFCESVSVTGCNTVHVHVAPGVRNWSVCVRSKFSARGSETHALGVRVGSYTLHLKGSVVNSSFFTFAMFSLQQATN